MRKPASTEAVLDPFCRTQSETLLGKLFGNLQPIDLIVYATANDVAVERHSAGPIGDVWIVRSRHEITVVLQSDIEIFELGRPVGGDRRLNPTANGPAGAHEIFCGECRGAVGVRDAGRHVGCG